MEMGFPSVNLLSVIEVLLKCYYNNCSPLRRGLNRLASSDLAGFCSPYTRFARSLLVKDGQYQKILTILHDSSLSLVSNANTNA